MESVAPSASTRLVRALVAGGILAAGWFVADAVLSPDPAAAASQIDLVPGGETPVADVLGTLAEIVPATTVLAPVTAPVVSTVDALAAPLAPVTTPILTPVRDVAQPVVDGVVTPVVAPVLDGADAVLTPILTPVLEPIVPILAPVVAPVVDTVDVVLPAVGVLVSTVNESGGILGADSGPAVSIALLGALAVGAASLAPGGPLAPGGRSPLSPANAEASPGSSALAEILSGVPARLGAAASAFGVQQHPHASPVFESDTTPD